MMEPTIHLRQAKAGDIPAILEIEQECFQEDSFSREQFVYLICRSKGTFYVVVEQLLMERTIETALDCRAVKITLEVKESNTPAIKLYMKNGFIPVGVKPNYYHDGSDAIYMQRHM